MRYNNIHQFPVEKNVHSSLPLSSPMQLIRKPKSKSSLMTGFKSATILEIDNFIDLNYLKIEPCKPIMATQLLRQNHL